MPAYTVAEAARYLSMPSPTLRSWFAGIEGNFKAVIHWEVSSDHRLSFSNLVEAHALRALRNAMDHLLAHLGITAYSQTRSARRLPERLQTLRQLPNTAR